MSKRDIWEALHFILHCVRSVRVRRFFGPYFPVFGLDKD